MMVITMNITFNTIFVNTYAPKYLNISQIQSRSFNYSSLPFLLHVTQCSLFFRHGFLFLLTLFYLLLWVRNHRFPIIHAHETNEIPLLATLSYCAPQLLLPGNYAQVVITVLRRCITTIKTHSMYMRRGVLPPR